MDRHLFMPFRSILNSPFVLGLLAVALASSCVSVNLKPKSPQKSKEYSVQAPSRPFASVETSSADVAWQVAKSGHTIAVLSECNETRDPSLVSLENETLQALNDYKIKKTSKFKFQDREALRSTADGSLDGVAVILDVVTFKKNSCNYTLTYFGRARDFEQELPAFEKFLEGFRIP